LPVPIPQPKFKKGENKKAPDLTGKGNSNVMAEGSIKRVFEESEGG